MKYKPEGASHLPILIRALNLSTGPVLEMGVGPFSTPVMHWLCLDKERPLLSYENDKKYFEQNKVFETSLHKIKLIENWDGADIENIHWGVVLIDHKPAERRRVDIKRIANNSDYIVVHDTEPSQEIEYHYNDPINGIYHLFKYRYDYQKLEPFTTVVSNLKDLSNL